MRLASGIHHGIRSVILTFLASCLAFMGLSAAGSAAHADTPYRTITHVYMNITALPSQNQASQYSQLITSLRQASGHAFRNKVGATQTTGRSLIRLSLTNGATNLDLWLTPGDLYLRGFTNDNGLTFQFNDGDYNLLSAMYDLDALPPGSGRTLGFGSNYNSMTQAAQRGRENTPLSFNDFWNSFYNLAYAGQDGNQMYMARSLMLMIQLTSESARFNDVYGIGAHIMGSNAYYPGLPLMQQYLENSWQRMSAFGYAVTQNPSTPPANITGVGTLYSWGDVARYLAMLIGNLNLPQEGASGDWNHTEL